MWGVGPLVVKGGGEAGLCSGAGLTENRPTRDSAFVVTWKRPIVVALGAGLAEGAGLRVRGLSPSTESGLRLRGLCRVFSGLDEEEDEEQEEEEEDEEDEDEEHGAGDGGGGSSDATETLNLPSLISPAGGAAAGVGEGHAPESSSNENGTSIPGPELEQT